MLTSVALYTAVLALALPQTPAGKFKEFHLKPFIADDADAVPLALRFSIEGDNLPLQVGRTIPVQITAKELRIDLNATGRFATAVSRRKPAVIAIELTGIGPKTRNGGRRNWLVAADESGYWISPADGLRTKWEMQELEFLDGDTDGAYDGAADWVRFGGGIWHRFIPELPWIASGNSLATLSLRYSNKGVSVHVERLLRDPSVSESQWSALAVCNEFRTRNGLPPMRLNLVLSDGCQKHARYLELNAYDYSKPWDGVGSHDEDPALPGYTKEGQEAARRCSTSSSADPGSAILSQTSTILHRASYLGDPRSGLGVGSGKGGYSVTGGPDAAPTSLSQVVVVPGPGSKDVPLSIRRERPTVEQDPSFYDRERGYPVSVTFGFLQITDYKLRLFDERSAEVLGTVFSPKSPVHSTRPWNAGSCVFVANEPLMSNVVYRVEFTARHDDRLISWHWSFTTR